jgi:ubiquinone biosynthesis monooxygenase Coq6
MSVVRRLAGIPTWGWNYGQEGVVATISFRDNLPTEQDEQMSPLANYNLTAYQKYLPTGPLAILPLWDGYASIVWSLPTLEAKRVKSLSNESFLKELNAAVRSVPKTDKWSVFEPEDGTNFPPAIDNFINLVNKATGGYGSVAKRAKREVAAVLDAAMSAGQLTDPLVIPPTIKHVCGPRFGFPLSFQQAKYYTSPRVALIGDAAHSIHPQAGQGLNLGLADSATLSASILDALATGQDYGSTRVLSKYGSERYKHNLAMMGLVDVLNSFFKDRIDIPIMSEVLNSQNLPFAKGKQLARSLGMLGVHNLGPIKQEMAKFAMGLK